MSPRPAARPRRARRGFTLPEVMVALAVAGLVLAAAYRVLAAAGDARARTEAARASMAGPAARAALEAWLRAAVVAPGAPFVGADREAGLSADALAFTVDDAGALHPGPHRVRLWVERAAAAPRRGLLAALVPLHPGPGEGADTLVLAADAAGLDVRYRTRDRGRPVRADAWRSDAALPEAVELTVVPDPLRAAGPGGGLHPVLRLPLRVPLRWSPDASEAADGA